MTTFVDAIFFIKDDKIIKEMMLNEFEALLDGIVEAPEFCGQMVEGVYLQIDRKLKIRGLLFFLVGFTPDGHIVSDWNIPINQLMQSAGRGPDLGGGKIRFVSRSQCSLPWHQTSLWDPTQQTVQLLIKVVDVNRLGILEDDEDWNGDTNAASSAQTGENIPTAIPVVVPTIPTALPVAEPLLSPTSTTPSLIGTTDVDELNQNSIPADPDENNKDSNNNQQTESLKKELEAMKAAFAVKIDKLQKERDEAFAKNKSIADTLKQHAKEHLIKINQEFDDDLDKKKQQIAALKNQLNAEQRRYASLKEQQVEQAASSQIEREELIEQLQNGQTVEQAKIDELKEAFNRELDARIEAATAKSNEALALREVELFYRDEQIAIMADEAKRLKTDKQGLLAESGNRVLQALDDNGVTFVAFHSGVGHVTVDLNDVGRYLDQRVDYLADRCGVSADVFSLWSEHYASPCCRYDNGSGKLCGKPISRVDLASQFVLGNSDCCDEHKH